MIELNKLDKLLITFDNFFKSNFDGISGSGRSYTQNEEINLELNKKERSEAGSLMRVNHSGEVAAQALYQGQSLIENNKNTLNYLKKAAIEEADHLLWTRNRLNDLGSKPSFLNPLWYGGAFFLGVLSRSYGTKMSVGFLAETERQVENHLRNHLQIFPKNDLKSIAILETMLKDEVEHAEWAEKSENFSELPVIIKSFMKVGSTIMIKISKII